MFVKEKKKETHRRQVSCLFSSRRQEFLYILFFYDNMLCWSLRRSQCYKKKEDEKCARGPFFINKRALLCLFLFNIWWLLLAPWNEYESQGRSYCPHVQHDWLEAQSVLHYVWKQLVRPLAFKTRSKDVRIPDKFPSFQTIGPLLSLYYYYGGPIVKRKEGLSGDVRTSFPS